ncbi:MAG: TrkA C-terminal domain-containing protein [Clostridia bacterium]
MKKPGWKERFSYAFDNLMSKGTVALVGLLFALTLLVVVLVSCVALLVAPDASGSAGSSFWNSLMRVLDAGNVSGDFETGNALYILLMIIATVCGLFVTSILIGIINSAFESKLASLRKGNSKVLESGHTLILGYDEHLISILSELIVANENEKRPAVVILCSHDKEELENEIAAQLPHLKNTRIICRCGDVTSFQALKNVSIEACARILVLGENDFHRIKAVLAAATLLNESNASPAIYITAVVNDEQNLEAMKLAGGERLEALYFEKIISRIFAQTCRQAGLSLVYQELFDFEGDEIYMEKAPSLQGKPFSELALYYRKAAVMGLKRGGRVFLNPPANTPLAAEDEVILIASDNGTALPSVQPASFQKNQLFFQQPRASAPETILILGYNHLTADIVNEIGQYAAKGSSLTVASPYQELDAELGAFSFPNLAIRSRCCNIFTRVMLESVLACKPDCIIVLSDDGEAEDADAKTLTLLLQLSHYYQNSTDGVTIVSEMKTKEHQELASCAKVNDFVIGSNLVSLIMTQVSQNRLLNPLFDELLTDEGCEIYIKPAAYFAPIGEPVSLYTLAYSTARAEQMLLGLRLSRENGGFDILINPDKSQEIVFVETDSVIVLSEN